MRTDSKVLFITVGYGSEDSCLKVISEFKTKVKNADVEYVYVENGESKPAKGVTDVSVIHYPDNPGYYGAIHKLIKEKDTSGYDWLIVSNPDLSFESDIDFSKLDSDTHFVIAPSIKSLKTGAEQNPLLRQRPALRKLKFLRFIYSFLFTAVLYDLISMIKQSLRGAAAGDAKVSDIYAPNGSFVLYSKKIMAMGFDFSHPGKLYGEEVFLGEFCYHRKAPILFYPSLRLRHEENHTTRRIANRRIFEYKKTSLSRLIQNWRPD